MENKQIERMLNESIEALQKTMLFYEKDVCDAATLIHNAFKKGNKVLVCGNGGSAADSQHFAAEFIGRFKKERQALPVIALTTDSSALTALSNDYGVEKVFARQVEALGNKEDILIAISTSGKSKNVLEAMEIAKLKNMQIIVLAGGGGGTMIGAGDINILVRSVITARIQEVHMFILHTICDLVEQKY